jgi:hypothetical protein
VPLLPLATGPRERPAAQGTGRRRRACPADGLAPPLGRDHADGRVAPEPQGPRRRLRAPRAPRRAHRRRARGRPRVTEGTGAEDRSPTGSPTAREKRPFCRDVRTPYGPFRAFRRATMRVRQVRQDAEARTVPLGAPLDFGVWPFRRCSNPCRRPPPRPSGFKRVGVPVFAKCRRSPSSRSSARPGTSSPPG